MYSFFVFFGSIFVSLIVLGYVCNKLGEVTKGLFFIILGIVIGVLCTFIWDALQGTFWYDPENGVRTFFTFVLLGLFCFVPTFYGIQKVITEMGKL